MRAKLAHGWRGLFTGRSKRLTRRHIAYHSALLRRQGEWHGLRLGREADQTIAGAQDGRRRRDDRLHRGRGGLGDNAPLSGRQPPRRPQGVPRLSDHRGGKIAVTCEKCGLRRRYDANAMLERIGDRQMPLLLIEIAQAEGCLRAGSKGDDRCMLHYDLAFTPMFRRR